MPYQRLLLKLKVHGIGNGVINWIEKWLTHRKQRVIVDGNKVLKCTVDTKVFRKVTNDTDKQSLQDDLDKLVKWSEKCQMLLNFGKCKCIHIGLVNMNEEYKMGDAVLGRTTQERDLGVTFSADMKVSMWDCSFKRRSNSRAN